jgi:hypothetical protein
MMNDVVRFEISMIAIGEAMWPTTSTPAARPVVAAHDFAPHDLRNVAIMGRCLFVSHKDVDSDRQ